MKRLACISMCSLFLAGCVSKRTAQSDFYFLPCAAKASVSFEGETQAGRGMHRFEVRRLAYAPPNTKEGQPMMASCVVYYAGDEYGPHILCVLDDCVDPLVRRVSKDGVEVYFLAGAHTHFRQRWTLLGSTAKLENQEEISWHDDPRMQTDVEKAAPGSRTVDSFRFIGPTTTMQQVIAAVGHEDRDMGSGLWIFEYRLADGTYVWIGWAEPDQVTYVKHGRTLHNSEQLYPKK